MLNFILVAGYNSLETVDTMAYCKGRMEEYILQFKRKGSLHFYFFDFKEGKIALQKVAKGGKKVSLTVVKQFAPTEPTLRDQKASELDKLMKGEDICDLMRKLDESSLIRVDFFYTHALREDELTLIYYRKSEFTYDVHFTSSAMWMYQHKYESELDEKEDLDIEYWLWNLKPYEAKKYFDQTAFLKVEPFLKLLPSGEYDNKSEVPLNIFSDEEMEILKQYIPVRKYPYEGKMSIDGIEGMRGYQYSWEVIDRQNGKVPLSFLKFLFLPEGALVALRVVRFFDGAIFFKAGSEKLNEDPRTKLLDYPADPKAERFNKLLFGFEVDSLRHFYYTWLSPVTLYSDGTPFFEMYNSKISKNEYLRIVDYQSYKPRLEPPYEARFTLEIPDFYFSLFFPPGIRAGQMNHYLIVEGVPFRQNFDIPMELGQLFLGTMYYDLRFNSLTQEHIDTILNGFTQDEGVIYITVMCPLYGRMERNIYVFDHAQKKYISSPIKWLNPAPVRYPGAKHYREFQGRKYQYEGGKFEFGNDTFLYFHELSDADNSILVQRLNTNLYGTITDEFRDFLLALEKNHVYSLKDPVWEAVEFPNEFDRADAAMRYAAERIPEFVETEYVFRPIDGKVYRMMSMIDVYLHIMDIGKHAPGSLRKLIFSCETNDLNPVLINIPTIDLYANKSPIISRSYYEPGSYEGLQLIQHLSGQMYFQQAWTKQVEKSHILFGRTKKIYRKIIKAIIHSKEYKSGNLSAETIITLHSPSIAVKRYLSKKAEIIKDIDDPYIFEGQVPLAKDPSSTALKVRYKLGDLLRFFSDKIKSSYAYHLAKLTHRPVITCLPGLGMNLHVTGRSYSSDEGYHKLEDAPAYTKKYAQFYKRHFGIERTPTKVLEDTVKTKHPHLLINANNQFTLDPRTEWFQGYKSEGITY